MCFRFPSPEIIVSESRFRIQTFLIPSLRCAPRTQTPDFIEHMRNVLDGCLRFLAGTRLMLEAFVLDIRHNCLGCMRGWL